MMKNKNKKEIDVIVEEIKNFPYHIRVENNPQKLANNILTKLRKDEIVIARGKVESLTKHSELVDAKSYYINDISLDDIVAELKDEIGKCENKNIILTARVVKDE